MFYYKDEKGNFLPVEVFTFDNETLANSFIVIKLGDTKEWQPTTSDIDKFVNTINEYFKGKGKEFSGLVVHDKINFEVLDKKTLKDGVVVVRVGDPNDWKPSEQYIKDVRDQITSALSDAGIKDVIVLDVLASLEVQ